MHIAYLADHIELAPTLARWHHEEWAGLLPEWSYEDAVAELRSHTARCVLPTTLLAMEGPRLLGSVSLLVEDLPDWRYLSPWLASLYVVPGARGRGVAHALIEHVVTEARHLGLTQLYLFTAGQQALYQRRGWVVLDTVRHHGREAVVMVRGLWSN